jgi:penicillin-binding protein 2
VYYALINNNIIDIMDFEKSDAGEIEKKVYMNFEKQQKTIFSQIDEDLKAGSIAYNQLDEETQVYEKYIVEELLSKKMGILTTDTIDTRDKTYLAWKKGTIGLGEYITYSINQGWIDISEIPSSKTYLDTDEVIKLVKENIMINLQSDREFCKKIYYFMLKNGNLSGYEICRILCEQGVLPEKGEDYQKLLKGEINAYQFIIRKIQKLEITPAQLALDPCSGSAVIVDPKTGHILACVSYPGYNNNRLVNQMDSSYFNELLNNRSLPLYNRATQQLTAPGSTFKPITAVAGLSEHVITSGTQVFCDGVFDKVETALHCWNRTGHGEIMSISDALKNSCNDYFCEISYRLGLKENNNYSENQALERLQTYAELFDLDKKSGIELTESKPQITNKYAIPSSIGQGTHNYTTVQLARYVTTLADRGTSFQLSILDKVANPDGTIIEEFKPKIQSQVDLPESIWNDIQKGMQQVVENNNNLKDLKIDAAGKTGTAEEVRNRPNHGLFIGYVPINEPQITIAVRIANGYSSGNAAAVAKDVFNYYFDLEEKSTILTGTASESAGNQHND